MIRFHNPVPSGTFGATYKQKGRLWSLGYHTGSDFPASLGHNIYAMRGGKVIENGTSYDKSFGYKVIICSKYDGHHYHAWYCHMPKNDEQATSLRKGSTIPAGKHIGNIGVTGNTSGPHCHVEVRSGDLTWDAANFRDPMKFGTYDDAPVVKPPVVKPPVVKPPVVKPPAQVALSLTALNIAGYTNGRTATNTSRMQAAAKLVNTLKPDLAIWVELSNKAVAKGPRMLTQAKTSLPNYDFSDGAEGQYIAYNKSTIKKIATGVLEINDKSILFEGDEKRAAWLAYEKKGKTGLEVAIHLENLGADALAVQQFSVFVALGYAKAKSLGIGLQNVGFSGDMNSPVNVKNKAKALNLGDVKDAAKRTKDVRLSTFNGGKPATYGEHIDYMFRRNSTSTKVPVAYFEVFSYPRISDHALIYTKTYLI